MESFIVRIYRREEVGAAEGPGPVGTVEATATGERIAFHSHQELLSALGADGKAVLKAAKAGRSSITKGSSSAAAARAKK
jgi:hypothetical protein